MGGKSCSHLVIFFSLNGALSSVGRALSSHGRGHWFESSSAHFINQSVTATSKVALLFCQPYSQPLSGVCSCWNDAYFLSCSSSADPGGAS